MLKHAQFESVYNKGRRHFSRHMTFFYLATDASQASAEAAKPAPDAVPAAEMVQIADSRNVHVGMTVSRALGGSVQRNRIRRRVRECVRRSLACFETRAVARGVRFSVVINPKRAVLTAAYELLRDEVERGFRTIAEAGAQDQKLAERK